MGKPNQMIKTIFCNMNSMDIFCKCLINGKVKLNGKFYSILKIDNNTIKQPLINEFNPIYWMNENPSFYNINFSKYNENYDKLITENIINNNNEWIKNNYFDVLTCLLINKYCVNFEIISCDKAKKVKLFISSGNIYNEIAELAEERMKLKFSKILINDEFENLIPCINNSDIEMLFRLTNGEFMDKPYKKEFIKFFISIVAKGNPTNRFKSYRNQGFCSKFTIKQKSSCYLCSYFDYHDETLFIKVHLTNELIGLSFANNTIKIITQNKLSDFSVEIIKGCDGILKEYL